MNMRHNVCVIGLPLLSVFCGIVLIITSKYVLSLIIRSNLILLPNTTNFERWRHLEEPLSMDIYLFNWTNPEEIYNRNVPPRLQEIGPYRFKFDLTRTNVVWNENGTVSYKMKKEWFYDPVGNKGDLRDNVTLLNIPAAGAVYTARTWNYFVRKGMSVTLKGFYNSMYIRGTVDDMLFKGIDDPLTKMAGSLPIFSGVDVPKMDKFGLFYSRNGSDDAEGTYNMGTGVNSVFGKLYSWNYNSENKFFEGNCKKIDASTGDNYDPDSVKDTIRMFTSDLCRPLIFEYVGTTEVDGIEGFKYTLGERTLDNGTKYPENHCYCSGECVPSGVFNTSACRYGAPAFPSLPHFYGADPYYNTQVEGLLPEKDAHEFYIVVEPNTGIPIHVSARLQVNFLLQPVPDISNYENVPRVFFPLMWTDQQSKLPSDLVPNIKLLLKIPMICSAFGTLLIVLGSFFIYQFVKRKRQIKKKEGEEVVPLKSVVKA